MHKADIPASAYSPLLHAVASRDARMVETVRRAIEHRQVLLAYQPIVQAGDHSSVAFYEGLIRVLDETGRVIPARDFFPSVEETEFGRMLDCIALEKGLSELRREPWLRLSINMSARSIGYKKWNRVLKRGLDAEPTVAERLILEITESSALLVPELVIQFMDDLQARGVSFAIDDFGAGYTSLRHFKQFSFDILKIEGEFARGVAKDPDNQVMIAAIVDIAGHFDLFTVAEQVENPEDAVCLTKLGIDCLQGYNFAAATVRPHWRQNSDGAQSA